MTRTSPAGRSSSALLKTPWVRLVVISAPAGWGKTCLLRDWRLADTASGTAWMSVDTGDNDPVRFWAHVITGVTSVSAGFDAALRVLTAPGAAGLDTALPMLVNELAALPVPLTLVFDDYHLVSNQEVLHSVAFLVEHLPPGVRLALAARADPELPLARLRARGELLEIRADDLRFTEDETAALLNGTMSLALAPADIRALQHRTEGWAAGLHLADLSLRGRPDPSAFIRAFAGDDRQIVDYLLAEVLDGLPAEIRAFLLRTSVLDRLSGPLCDAVAGGEGAQRILEEMERSSLFLVRLDTRRHWYRYHHLFGDLLRHELDRAEPGLAAVLHRRAWAWHQAHGNLAEAIGHAISAGDLAEARELIVSGWHACFNEGLVETVESWLDRLPPEIVADDARLCLVRAWLARNLGRLDEVERWVEIAEAGAPRGPMREGITSVESAACMLRAGYRQMIGDLAGAEPPSRRAAALEASVTPLWRAGSLSTMTEESAIQVDLSTETVRLPLYLGIAYKGTPHQEKVWYILLDASDSGLAHDLGVNFAPKLVNIAISDPAAVQAVTLDSPSPEQNRFGPAVVNFAGAPDFSPTRIATPGPNGFPLAKFQPGSVAGPGYSPFIRIAGSNVVYNAPIVAVGDGPFDVTHHPTPRTGSSASTSRPRLRRASSWSPTRTCCWSGVSTPASRSCTCPPTPASR
jgi:ATP/maltotriose-dependent transcriptional regulator MalT